MSYIEFTDIYKTFGNLEVLKGISLEIEEGEVKDERDNI